MSMFHIVEGNGNRTGIKYFQVYLGRKKMGDPCKSREDAESYIGYLESLSDQTAQSDGKKG